MKLKKALPLLSVAVVSLTSCGNIKPWIDNLDSYVFEMDYHDGFNILQLTDIHWNYNTSAAANEEYLNKIFNEVENHVGKIDLVEVTGDQFMLANQYHVKRFVQYMESKAKQFEFQYAVIWGNHDSHGLYNPNWLSKQFARAEHAIYMDPNDDLYGRSNFMINLVDRDDGDKVKWQIANLDSGASISDTAVSPFRDYDYIRPEQTKWFVAEHDRVPGNVPAIAYYHIPQYDNESAWGQVQLGAGYKNKFFKLEGFGESSQKSDFLNVAKNHNLKAAFMGHAHNVDWTVEYEGVVLGLGVKTGPELYYAHVDVNSSEPEVQAGLASLSDPITENFDLIGASLVTLTNATGDFSLEHLYLNVRETGDFIKWEIW